jgi:hypothetical protein
MEKQKEEIRKQERIASMEREYSEDPYGFAEKIFADPDDFQVRAVKKGLSLFKEALDDNRKVDDDTLTELADNSVSIWEEDLCNWLKERNSESLVNQAIKEGLVGVERNPNLKPKTKDEIGIFDFIKAGQYLEYFQIFQGIRDLLEK